MKIIQGDLIALAKKGEFDLIIHGCNCFCAMGAGIAKSIRREFPQAYEEDCKTQKGDKSKLGSISWAKVPLADKDLIVVNAYTQYRFSWKGKDVNYEAIQLAFREIKAQYSGLTMAYPAIGAGLGGGDWEKIAEIISEELSEEDHTFVEYRS
ncbi:MAG: macro domain-containing protein [Bacteroidota bacterium]